jgi:sec-independent protein translocase protein TatA
MPNIGFTEIAIIFLLVVVLFGARRIPELAKSLGMGIREFKKSLRSDEEETPRKIEDKQE